MNWVVISWIAVLLGWIICSLGIGIVYGAGHGVMVAGVGILIWGLLIGIGMGAPSKGTRSEKNE